MRDEIEEKKPSLEEFLSSRQADGPSHYTYLDGRYRIEKLGVGPGVSARFECRAGERKISEDSLPVAEAELYYETFGGRPEPDYSVLLGFVVLCSIVASLWFFGSRNIVGETAVKNIPPINISDKREADYWGARRWSNYKASLKIEFAHWEKGYGAIQSSDYVWVRGLLMTAMELKLYEHRRLPKLSQLGQLNVSYSEYEDVIACRSSIITIKYAMVSFEDFSPSEEAMRHFKKASQSCYKF